MASVKDIYGSVYANSAADFLARIIDADGEFISGVDVASLVYTIREYSICSEDKGTIVTGHDEVAIVVSEVFTDGLQTDGSWTVDEIGYNFRHRVDTTTDEAFSRTGFIYRIRYDLTLLDGQKVVFRYEIKAI